MSIAVDLAIDSGPGPVKLNEGAQSDYFLCAAPSIAAIAGFGSGKTFAAFMKIFIWLVDHPGVPMGYFAPTYALIRDIFVPQAEEFCAEQGIACEYRKAESKFYMQGFAPIICKSMDNPSTIVGFQIGHAAIDEIDILSATKAWEAWRKIKARCRIKLYAKGKKRKRKNEIPNQMALSSTPEGFKFAYEAFKKNPLPGSALFQMSTYDNAHNLPAGYINELMANYPPQLVDAYIRGIFTNLTQGTVYTCFDRDENDAPGILPRKGERLHIGMDFNVTNMSAVVHTIRREMPVACGELVEIYDTPAMIKAIRNLYPSHPIVVYPDASGDSRKTVDASKTDLKLLKQAGFAVVVNPTNPPVKDRINSMNAMFLNMKGERRYRVNVDQCPKYVECLEQQPYDNNGLPDKGTGMDHLPDGGGYFINQKFGIDKPSSQVARLVI